MGIELIAWSEYTLPSRSDRMERFLCRTCGRNSYECFSCRDYDYVYPLIKLEPTGKFKLDE